MLILEVTLSIVPLRETSPLETEIGDPDYYSVDSVYFSDFSLAFPQEVEAVKRNEHREKGGFCGRHRH